MELKLVSEKLISGLSTRTDNATEMAPGKGRIAGLWQTFDRTIAVDYQGGERVYGVYYRYESDHNGQFTVLAGFDGNSTPAGVEVEQVLIPQGQYLVFTHKGEMPQIAIDAWTEIWNYFSDPNVPHKRLFSTDFEYYPGPNEIAVHIAVSES